MALHPTYDISLSSCHLYTCFFSQLFTFYVTPDNSPIGADFKVIKEFQLPLNVFFTLDF